MCIKLWGLQGAAIAVAISFLVMSIVRVFYAWKHINQMNIIWYVTLTLLYVIFIIVVVYDAPLTINIPLYFVILGIVCLMSKDVIKPALNILKMKLGR